MDINSVLGGGGLVSLILAAGAGIKWWVGRRDARKDPIPKDQAAVALSASAVEVSHAVLAQVRAEMSDLRTDLSGVRGRLTAAEATIQHHESIVGAALGYIEALLSHIRTGRTQPAPPVPSDLRDLIDPALHD